MTPEQERCIEVLDDLVENGVDIEKLSGELPWNEYRALSRRINRAFGGIKDALLAFGLFDSNAVPSEYELYRCFYIDDYYKIAVNKYEKEFLCDIYYLNEVDFKRLSKSLMPSLRKDAIDEFYRKEFPVNVKYTFLESPAYKHVCSYICLEYGNLSAMMKAYGTPSHIFVDYDYNRLLGDSIKNGHTFERIVEDVLKALYDNVSCQETFGNCRPDFVIGKKWFDAKLSRNTALHPQSTMIERYLAHTEDLSVIYARDFRKPHYSNGVHFTHISEYYPQLLAAGREDLIERCKLFISNIDDVEAVI